MLYNYGFYCILIVIIEEQKFAQLFLVEGFNGVALAARALVVEPALTAVTADLPIQLVMAVTDKTNAVVLFCFKLGVKARRLVIEYNGVLQL